MPEPAVRSLQAILVELARVPRTDFRAAVATYLRAAAEGLGVERAGLWYFTPDRARIVEAYRYERTPGRLAEPGEEIAAVDYPRYFAALAAGGIIAAADACGDPRTDEFTESYLRPHGIPSLLDVPIWRGGELAGILCLEPVGPPRAWTEAEQLFASGVAAMITLGVEVEARRAAEDAALARERELRAILDQVVDVVTVVDRRGELRYLNRAGLRSLGAPEDGPIPSREQLRGATPLTTAEGVVIAPHETPLARALQGAVVLDALLYAVSPVTGRRMVTRTSAAPVYGDDGGITGAVAVTRDVTALVELDEMKEQFLRVAAHELRTPVGIIKGYAQLMERRIADGKPVTAELVASVLLGADRLTRLVQDLLEALRYQSDVRKLAFEFGRVDLHEVAVEAVRDLSVAKKLHRFVFAEAQSDLVVEGDANRLRQALLILLDNATKYAPPGTTVTLHLAREGGDALVQVDDEGVGVPEEKREQIFEIFYRAHTDTPADYGGLGVGLFLARQIARRHGGDVGYTPRARGSTFWIRLPAGAEGRR